jgi:lactate dehydrogenase-like 2-hydroxyacid dehydrogenase
LKLCCANPIIWRWSLRIRMYDIIGAAQLLQMKAGAMLVNIARGRVMDDAALASALRSLSIRP